jgi:hypothetical protein
MTDSDLFHHAEMSRLGDTVGHFLDPTVTEREIWPRVVAGVDNLLAQASHLFRAAPVRPTFHNKPFAGNRVHDSGCR